ncbi:MAG: HD domain-containing phosphohydrolase [Sedimentibacter sp.]
MNTTAGKLRNTIKSIKLNKITLAFIIFLIISATFINSVWVKSVKTREEKAIQLAETFETALQKSLITKLDANISDLDKFEYKEIKNNLIKLVKKNSEIRFAYILVEKEGKILISVDSEEENSKDYSPPGQEYTEVSSEIIKTINSGQSTIINSLTDRWGSWVSILVPMKNIDTGETIAVFGIDYPAEDWNDQAILRTLQISGVMLCLLIILVMLNIAYYQYLQINNEKTKLLIMDGKLQKSESLFKAIFDQASVGIAIGYNDRYNIAYENDMININSMFENITGRTKEELKTTKWPEITHPDDLIADMEMFEKFKSGEIDGYVLEKRYIKPDNTEIWINKKISSLKINNFEDYNHLCIIEDISERKEKEAQIQYMIDHDYMTNLYNRKHFEELMADIENSCCVPVSIISVDINGLRMINDAFGYSEGDNLIVKASEILKESIRPNDFLSRTGGDEFVLMLLNTNNEEAHEIIRNIENKCLHYNNINKTKLYEINFSMGCATKENSDDISIFNAVKTADEDLRNNMLLNRKSSHSNIITSMLATVYEKSQETEEHAIRLKYISRKIGEILKLSNKSISELELLAMLHDIGKVGIDERVLNKDSDLNSEEWAMMKKHPEIGYRIAKSSIDLEPIADYILCHHERWDGNGYPRGLKGEEIPLLSRIIAVADAYDAMTQDRVYRKALTKEQAINEIQKNAGKQFDWDIAQSFIENVNNFID